MAKIKQVKMRLNINPNRLYQETVVSICYDSTDRCTENYRRPIPKQRFYIKLPQVVADALGVADVRGDNQVDVMENFNEAIERFKKLETEVNEVILYSFDVEPKLGDQSKYRSAYKTQVWAGAFKETVAIAGDGQRRYSYEVAENDPLDFPGAKYHSPSRSRQDGSRYDCQVPWTERNEQFFIWVRDRMGELVLALAGLSEPDKLVETISAGRLLPLGETQTEEQTS